MPLTTQPLTMKTLNDKERGELDEIRRLLSQLKTQSENNLKNASTFMDQIHTDLIDDSFKEIGDNDGGEKVSNTPRNNLFQYLFGIAGDKAKTTPNQERKQLRTLDSDDESIYEDYGSETKTIFRSPSFEVMVGKEHEDDNVDVFSGESAEVDSDCNTTTNSSHGFQLDDFTDTFNLDDDNVNGDDNDNEMAVGNSKVLASPNNSLKSKKSTERLNVLKTKDSSDQDNSFYPSVSSGGSLQFKDVSMHDVLSDLYKDNGDVDLGAQTSMEERSFKKNNNELTFDESKLVDAIVTKLQRQLNPTLEKLSEISDKYETMKKLYKLPSISNLNEEVRLKYHKKSKKFNLEFHEDVIKTLISEESSKINNRRKVSNYSVISAQDQMRLNFNKFRKLNTITEEQGSDTSLDEKDLNNSKLMMCERPDYQKSKDTRTVHSLTQDELVQYLKLIREGKIKDLNRVEHLVSLFEIDQSNIINRMDNTQLKGAILTELNKRRVI